MVPRLPPPTTITAGTEPSSGVASEDLPAVRAGRSGPRTNSLEPEPDLGPRRMAFTVAVIRVLIGPHSSPVLDSTTVPPPAASSIN